MCLFIDLLWLDSQWLCSALKLMTTRISVFYFSRHQNSQHFSEDLLAVNASAFSFVFTSKRLITQAPPAML